MGFAGTSEVDDYDPTLASQQLRKLEQDRQDAFAVDTTGRNTLPYWQNVLLHVFGGSHSSAASQKVVHVRLAGAQKPSATPHPQDALSPLGQALSCRESRTALQDDCAGGAHTLTVSPSTDLWLDSLRAYG